MTWSDRKCQWGAPFEPFDKVSVTHAVGLADFHASVFVHTATLEDRSLTRYAYTYVFVGGYRICVVGHAHKKPHHLDWVAGHCFIPGWEGWQMGTPDAALKVIKNLTDRGTFPGDGRYPHPV